MALMEKLNNEKQNKSELEVQPNNFFLGGMEVASRMVDLDGGAVETAYRWVWC